MFRSGDYGIESASFTMTELLPEHIEALLRGTPEQIARVEKGWEIICALVETMRCEVLRAICKRFIERHGEAFKRCGAARGVHHARRGGLVEHVSEMMLMADSLSLIYPRMNRSLLLAGALLHDCGKLIENQFEERGFEMPFSATAELYGHIAIGLEIVRGIARKVDRVDEVEGVDEGGLERSMDRRHVIDCLCHLILSHHGTQEWGSPVVPKMPEAQLLHFIDNISAKLEIMRTAMETAPEIGPGVFDCPWPMKKNLVRAPGEILNTKDAEAAEETPRCGYHFGPVDESTARTRCFLKAGHEGDHEQ